MWIKPWSFKEGFTIGAGLLITGFLLQCSIGPLAWSHFKFPLNIIILVLLLVAITCCYLFRNQIYAFKFLTSGSAAIPSLFYTALLTIMMGLIPQVNEVGEIGIKLGLNHMLTFWPFVLTYFWMTIIVGMETINQIINKRHWSSLISHAGLFIALVTATLGNPDMQRLKMTVKMGKPEWRAVDDEGNIIELNLAINLHQFKIDEYAPKLVIIDNTDGQPLPKKQPQSVIVENKNTIGQLLDWHIKVDQRLDYAAQVTTQDSTTVMARYVNWPSVGATSAVHLTAQNTKTGEIKQGWVSCGSFAFPYQGLTLNKKHSIVMPERESKKFSSFVSIYTQSGQKLSDTILVNKPMVIDGWNIYQLSYDEKLGRWSDTSIFELVKDPWLPAVYTGIVMMLLGACVMFFRKPKKEEVGV